MAIKRILRLGDSRLFCQAKPVTEFASESLYALAADIRDTVRAFDGAGLSAPQIGVNLQVVLFGVPTLRYPDAGDIPETLLINPEITVLSEKTTVYWEGCLSVPGLRGLVSRPDHILYSGYDIKGNRIEREVTGFHSRVVQHEVDHLEGVLFPQRVADLRYLGFEDEIGFDQLIHKSNNKEVCWVMREPEIESV